ncbi:MAG: hypothetical protein II969_09675 [Anaerolineaceae bacterium]|nr:hypothetical protein [Anaerolineaceae bacterium]
MRLEKAVNKKFLNFQSVLGFYHWMKVVKSNLFRPSNLSFSDRIWSVWHGFAVSDLNIFGKENLRENYKDYLSTRDYYRLFPINKEYSFWIDDKLTTKNVFSKFDEYLPDYYFQLEKNRIFKLADCPPDCGEDVESIIRVIKSKHTVACKRLWGSGGEGFIRLDYDGQNFLITGEKVSEVEMMDFIKSLHSHLIMEYVVNHHLIRSIWPESLNTLRVLVSNCDGKIIVMRSFVRFGNKNSHGVDNAHSGGIEAIVDEDTGKILFTQLQDKWGTPTRIQVHPDSGVSFDIEIPYWNEIISKLNVICSAYPQLRYLGFDVAVTEDSFRIIEINSHSGLMAAQTKCPLLRDPKTRDVYRFFGLK